MAGGKISRGGREGRFIECTVPSPLHGIAFKGWSGICDLSWRSRISSTFFLAGERSSFVAADEKEAHQARR